MNKNSVPILLFALVFVLAATSGFAQMTVNETFRHDSAPNWIFDGAAHLTSSAEDPTDDGWLRLTGIALDQAGSAIYNVAFSSTDGVQITFWYATYGGTHADGISFYLIDGATLVPTVGGTGGALGYCWRHDDPAKLHSGVTNGYVGIGLDEWGNYVNSTGNYYGTGGYAPGLHPGIGIRGPGNLDDVGTFPYLAYVAATIETGSRSTPKKCEITITPSPTQHITVKINDVTYINNYDISGYAMPATLKMGFGSSTGNSTNYHEIRDLTVGGANPSMTTLVSAPDPSFIGQSVTLTATVSPGDATGTVFFYDGASLIGSATLVGAVATMSTSSLTIGTHNLSAVYQGDHKYASSQGTDTHEVLNLPEIDIQRPAGSTISDGGTDNIGEILLDGPVYLQYTICNQVGAQLVIPAGGVTAANMNNCSSFNVITSLPLYIDAGNCSTLDISFIIDNAGPFSFDMDVANNDADENPYDITISGIGVTPEMDVRGNGNSIADGDATPSWTDFTDFGYANVYNGTVDHDFVIYNLGAADLHLSGSPIVTISGPHAADFTVRVQPNNLVPKNGNNTTFWMVFDPSAPGVRTATLSIANDDRDENPYNFSLKGIGRQGPEIDVQRPAGTNIADGGTDNLGNQLIGSVDLEYSICNFVEDGPLTIPAGGVIATNMVNCSGFTVTSTLPINISFGNCDILKVSFTVDALGAFSLEMIIDNNDMDENPYNILISGDGSQPTNIELSAFNAEVTRDGIVLNWTTQTEVNNAGFNIFRSTEENGTYGKVNESLIQAQGNAMSGASYRYVDKPEQIGNYYYQLQSLTLNGEPTFHGPVFAGVTAVDIQKYLVPDNYLLSQNYPNPFNPETTIEYSLPKANFVEITIYDTNGKLVRQLVSGQQQAGKHWVKWNGRDANGVLVSSGVYLTIMKAGDFRQMNKMILMK